MFAFVAVQTKVVSCNSANKSCLLQDVQEVQEMQGLNGERKETETKGVINSLYKVSEEFDTQLVRKHPEFAPFY